jgi:hypothetical protein
MIENNDEVKNVEERNEEEKNEEVKNVEVRNDVVKREELYHKRNDDLKNVELYLKWMNVIDEEKIEKEELYLRIDDNNR